MKIFLDTANLNAIKEKVESGVIDGVTTNPTLVAREGNVDFHTRIKEICDIVEGPVNAEVISTESEGMIEEARELSKLASNVVVKIPMIEEGLKAIKVLSEEGIETNVTLVFSANQALLAAKAGANYVSPFVGRLDDRAHQGLDLIEDIRNIFDNFSFETEIVMASVRGPLHVKKAALKGADIATVPAEVLDKMFHHPLTDKGLERFLNDWEEVQK